MNLKKKDGHIQGKSAIIKRGNNYTQILEVLFNEGVKLSGGNALIISKILTDNNIDHVFIGGIVIGCHTGRPRSTQDVDLIVNDEHNLNKSVIQQLSKAVASKKVEKYPSFISFIVKSAVGDREVLDLITSKSGSYGLVFSNYNTISISGLSIKIPTAEMLMVLKYTAYINPIRPKSKKAQDWADLLAIVDANPNIRIDKVCEMADGVLPGFGQDLKEKIQIHRHGF